MLPPVALVTLMLATVVLISPFRRFEPTPASAFTVSAVVVPLMFSSSVDKTSLT